MRCKHNSPWPQLGSGRHLVCLSITRSAQESSCVSSRNAKRPPQLLWQPVELLHTERSEPPKWTKTQLAMGALHLPGTEGGQPEWQVATGSRAALWGYGSPGCKEEQLQAWRAQHRHKEQLIVSLQRRCTSQSPDRVSGNFQPTAELLNIRAGIH